MCNIYERITERNISDKRPAQSVMCRLNANETSRLRGILAFAIYNLFMCIYKARVGNNVTNTITG